MSCCGMMVWVIFWVEEAVHTVKNTMESSNARVVVMEVC